MKQNYETLYFSNFIERCVESLGKPIIYLRSYGWNNSTNIEKINESMQAYKNILPSDMYDALFESEFVFLVLENIAEAIDFCEDIFPESQASCEKEFYIHFSIINELGQNIFSN